MRIIRFPSCHSLFNQIKTKKKREREGERDREGESINCICIPLNNGPCSTSTLRRLSWKFLEKKRVPRTTTTTTPPQKKFLKQNRKESWGGRRRGKEWRRQKCVRTGIIRGTKKQQQKTTLGKVEAARRLQRAPGPIRRPGRLPAPLCEPERLTAAPPPRPPGMVSSCFAYSPRLARPYGKMQLKELLWKKGQRVWNKSC